MKSKQDLAIVTAAGEDHAIVRPWLQDFTASICSIISNTALPRCRLRFRPSTTPDTMNGCYGAHPTNIRGWTSFPGGSRQEDQKIATRAALPPETTAVPPTEAADGDAACTGGNASPGGVTSLRGNHDGGDRAPVDGTTASEELQTGEDAETEAAEKAAAQPETTAQGRREASPML